MNLRSIILNTCKTVLTGNDSARVVYEACHCARDDARQDLYFLFLLLHLVLNLQ